MSANRSNGQTLLSVAVDQRLLGELDNKRGLVPRSAFVRECLVKYLKLDESLIHAPDRTGKAGRPTHKPKEKTFATKEEIRANKKNIA